MVRRMMSRRTFRKSRRVVPLMRARRVRYPSRRPFRRSYRRR